jgi:hypothetical protein
MRNELINRILTSIVLLPILIYATVYSGTYLLVLLGIFYLLSMFEIIKNTKNLLFISFASVVLFFSFYLTQEAIFLANYLKVKKLLK